MKEDLFKMSICAVSGPSSAPPANTQPQAKPANTPPPSSRATAQDTVNISSAGQQASKTNTDTDSENDGH